MNIVFLLLGYNFLAMQGVFYFMMAVFSSEIMVGKYQSIIAMAFMCGLPLACVVGAVLMTVAQMRGWAYPYAWTLLPVPFAILYIALVLLLVRS